MSKHFILYRVDWNETRGKYDKQPCSLDGRAWPVSPAINATDHATAVAALATLDPAHYRLGFWFTAPLQMAFLDFDECVTDGVIDAEVQAIIRPFLAMGAFFEFSSSGTGVHVVCRHSGQLPSHSCKQPTEHTFEFYTEQRGMCFGDRMQGDWNVDCSLLLPAVLQRYFPPSAFGEATAATGTRHADWRGPEDDDELIRRMLSARASAAVALGGKVSLQQLWAGECEHNSSNDMSLAQHLAFWTGGDAERMTRLMWRSGMVRDKWRVHRTYLRGLTVHKACIACTKVYQEPQRDHSALQAAYGAPVVAAPQLLPPAPVQHDIEAWVQRINQAGTLDEILDEIVPQLAVAGIPSIRAERLVQTLSKKLDLFDSKLPVGQLRKMICPPVLAHSSGSSIPDWAASLCYVLDSECFYDTLNGTEFAPEGLRTEFSRHMPMKQNGDREDPVKWLRERWDVPVVDTRYYRPDQPAYFTFANKRHANRFVASSVPDTDTAYTQEGIAAIQAFHSHLKLLCGGRDDVLGHLLSWIAHNVQHPGRKIRWSPLIKGIPGDGKSLIGTVMRNVMGHSNVKTTSINSLTNSGGFSDWAIGAAVNVIEEIHLTGKERHKIFNAIKLFISDEMIDLNSKGARSGGALWNPTNHIAFTNFPDGIPVDKSDRRWMVLFTPFGDIDDLVRAMGLQNEDDVPRRLGAIAEAAKSMPGQFRRWLLELDISAFNPDGRAPFTSDKANMQASGSDELEDMVMSVIERGGMGVTTEVFSGACLQRLVRLEALRQAVDLPSTTAWHHMLVRLGYQKHSKAVWWAGTSHRIWSKSPKFVVDHAAEILQATIKST